MKRSPIPDSLPMFGYNWIITHHKSVNENGSPSNASKYADFLKSLLEQNVRWVSDCTNCVKLLLRTKVLEFIPLLDTQGIMAYNPKRLLRQLGRIQELPHTFDLTECTIIFYKRMCPNEIWMKIPIIEGWGDIV